MELTKKGIQCTETWKSAGIHLPAYDIEKITENTVHNPKWVHFGAGNIFRSFLAALQQKLLNQGDADYGIIAVNATDYEVIEKIYTRFDNLSLLVLMAHDGKMDTEVIASVSEIIKAESSDERQWSRLKEIFRNPSLQMASFTITEKGYALTQMNGELLPAVQSDIENGPELPKHTMAMITSLLYGRYRNGKPPIAVVSMDNCSKNGKKLSDSVAFLAERWVEKGFVERAFLDYIRDENRVSFPWTMIDKITPNPAARVQKMLEDLGVEEMDILTTNVGSLMAPFVNAEVKEYLVVEDRFPNGRPPLEKAGVIFTDRTTVDRTEKMKVGTCLNPLHTALAILGCLLGYHSIAEEMKDIDLVKLIKKIAFDEAMAVVVDPGIIKPEEFVREVIELRFPNPYIPDTPQRIAADTSQKIPVRYGKTLEAYRERNDLDIEALTYIPLVFAAWCRYLTGADDEGKEMKISSDPLLPQLREYLQGISLENTDHFKEKLRPILSNKTIFGVDLYEVNLAEKVEEMFCEMMSEKGAVRKTLKKYL